MKHFWTICLVILFIFMVSREALAERDAISQQTLKQPSLKQSSKFERVVASSQRCPEGMVAITGGTFCIGADDHYHDEKLIEDVTVDGFCMDKYEITNAQFTQFVKETGYVTIADAIQS